MVWLIRIKGGLLSKIRKKISKKELESIEKTIQEKKIKKIEITKDENLKINKVKPEFHKEKHKTDELIACVGLCNNSFSTVPILGNQHFSFANVEWTICLKSVTD